MDDSKGRGPATGVLVVQLSGLGVPSSPALDPFHILGHRREQNRVEGRQWFSSITYYFGPFDDIKGIQGSRKLYRLTNLYGKPPQVYLTATETGLGIVPTSNSMMRRFRGRQETIWTPYSDIREIDLKPATKARMAVMTPGTASQLGEVMITTKDNRTATLKGSTVDSLSKFLSTLGATIQE